MKLCAASSSAGVMAEVEVERLNGKSELQSPRSAPRDRAEFNLNLSLKDSL